MKYVILLLSLVFFTTACGGGPDLTNSEAPCLEYELLGRCVADGADGADGQQGPKGDTGPQGPVGPQGEPGQNSNCTFGNKLNGVYINLSFFHEDGDWLLGDNSTIKIMGNSGKFKHPDCGKGEVQFSPDSDGCRGTIRARFNSEPDLCLDGNVSISAYEVVVLDNVKYLITYLMGISE